MSTTTLLEIEKDIERLLSIENRLERIYLELENRPYSSRMQIQFKIEMRRSFQCIESIIRKCKTSDAIRSPNGITVVTDLKNRCLEIESLWRRGIRLACTSTNGASSISAVEVLSAPPEPTTDMSSAAVKEHLPEHVDSIFLAPRPREELRKHIVRINGNLQYLLDVAENESIDSKEDSPTPREESLRPGLDPVELDSLSGDHDGATSLQTVLRATGFALLGGTIGMVVGGPPLALMVGAKAGAIGATSAGVVGVLSGAGVGMAQHVRRGVDTLTSRTLDSPVPPPPPPPPTRRKKKRDDEEGSDEEDPLLELTEPSVWDARPNSFF